MEARSYGEAVKPSFHSTKRRQRKPVDATDAGDARKVRAANAKARIEVVSIFALRPLCLLRRNRAHGIYGQARTVNAYGHPGSATVSSLLASQRC